MRCLCFDIGFEGLTEVCFLYRDGDVYGALRDCHATIRIDKQHVKAHLRLARCEGENYLLRKSKTLFCRRVVRCLLELNMTEESRAYLSAFKEAFPDHANSRWVNQIQTASKII